MGGNGGGGWGREEGRSMNHIKFPCHIRSLYGESIDIHVLVFKWKSVCFDNLFRNMIFGPQLFVPMVWFKHILLLIKSNTSKWVGPQVLTTLVMAFPTVTTLPAGGPLFTVYGLN